MKNRIRITLMRCDFASRNSKRFGGEPIEHAFAQHLAQAGGPDLCASLDVASTDLRTSGSLEHLGHTRTYDRDRADDLHLWTVRQAQRSLDFVLQFIRAREIGLVDNEHLSDLHDTGFQRLDIVA